MSNFLRAIVFGSVLALTAGCDSSYYDDAYDYDYDLDSGSGGTSSGGGGSDSGGSGSGGGSYSWSYECDTGRVNSIPIPKGSCEAEYKNYAQVFGCNQVDYMNSAACSLEQCTGSPKGCGGYPE